MKVLEIITLGETTRTRAIQAGREKTQQEKIIAIFYNILDTHMKEESFLLYVGPDDRTKLILYKKEIQGQSK